MSAPRCAACHDTGSISKHLSGSLDCISCEASADRAALETWLGNNSAMSNQDISWLVHQRALAMAPKQEAPGKYLNNEEVNQLVAALAMGADNTEALRSEAPRRLVAPLWAQSDCIAAALRIFQDVPAAQAAANGAMTDEQINWHAKNIYGTAATAQEIEFAKSILAAADPNAALELVGDIVRLWDSQSISPEDYNEEMYAIEMRMRALSGAKGN